MNYSELLQLAKSWGNFISDRIIIWRLHIIQCSKREVAHALCHLYGLEDEEGRANVKLLIGSLHWMRKVRNSCAHNERVYCIKRTKGIKGNSGRILEKYFNALGTGYSRNLDQRLIDLIVYFKYYLPKSEYKQFVSELKNMLKGLEIKIHPHAFEYVRAQIGVRDLADLDTLLNLPKDDIEYNKFDK